MKRITVLITIAVFFLGIFACKPSQSNSEKPIPSNEYFKEYHLDYIHYFKDSRTELCFAYFSRNSRFKPRGFAQVPCSKCEHLFKKNQ